MLQKSCSVSISCFRLNFITNALGRVRSSCCLTQDQMTDKALNCDLNWLSNKPTSWSQNPPSLKFSSQMQLCSVRLAKSCFGIQYNCWTMSSSCGMAANWDRVSTIHLDTEQEVDIFWSCWVFETYPDNRKSCFTSNYYEMIAKWVNFQNSILTQNLW